MKKKINIILGFIGHFLIFFSCYFNLPKFCAYLIQISILKNKIFRKKIKSRNIAIVLDREIGHRDIEIISASKNKTPEFLFLRRSITKIILFYFCSKKKFFFNYLKPNVCENDYFNQTLEAKNKHEKFWTIVISNIKKNYQNKILSFITFNYTYFAEPALYAGCNRNKIPIYLWHKEGIKTELEADIEACTWGKKYNHVIKYFDKISVYNHLVKKMFVKIDKSSKKKITVNGCPRIKDYLPNKSYKKK